MASKIIGRTTCPECAFKSAHVKQKEEAGKHPYRYCPECGAQYYARSDRQAADLLAKVRPEGAAGEVQLTLPEPEAAPARAPAKRAPVKAEAKPEAKPEEKPAPAKRVGFLESLGI